MVHLLERTTLGIRLGQVLIVVSGAGIAQNSDEDGGNSERRIGLRCVFLASSLYLRNSPLTAIICLALTFVYSMSSIGRLCLYFPSNS